jgi:hypothetical protein
VARKGSKRSRRTTLIFVLTRPALVEFVVFQVSPDCQRIGRFRVPGHAGQNRVRLRSRIGHRRLAPGTYRITARPLPHGRAVLDTRLVVVTRANKDEIVTARRADACAQRESSRLFPAGFSATATPPSGNVAPASQVEKRSGPSGRPRHGVLGARFVRAVEAARENPVWILSFLGIGLALLAVAALPARLAPNRRTALMLDHRRETIAFTGAAALVAVMVAYLLQ